MAGRSRTSRTGTAASWRTGSPSAPGTSASRKRGSVPPSAAGSSWTPRGVRAAPHTCHRDGGAGGEALARLVLEATNASTHAVRFVYKDEDAFQEKVAKVATSIYGAADVKYDAAALDDLERLQDAGLDALPVCIAKTQLSLSDDERALGAPTEWTLEVRGIRPSAGAGFLVVLAGDIMRMPGLGEEPAALSMDIDDTGRIKGLF